MPEIAEVRVVAATLKKQILNKKIINVKILYSGIIMDNVDFFTKSIVGRKIVDIKTYGKWIMFNLGDKSILSHLRMEGKYFYVPSTNEITKHEHVIFTLDNGMDLRYADVRKFGKMQVVNTSEIFNAESIKKLGLEPDDEKLTSNYLLDKLKSKSIPIKEALLDQSIINGLGNIYANEVLFASMINPMKLSSKLSLDDCEKIIDNSRKIIKRSFEMGGCTIRSYTSSLGVIGHYQDELKVQGREGQGCFRCGKSVKRIKIGGRSTFYCENCQK